MREEKSLTYESDDENLSVKDLKKRKDIEEGYKGHLTNPLIAWAEERIGHKLLPLLKQKKAVSTMLAVDFTPDQIKKCWEELETDEFWSSKGFDFMTVLGQISKMKTKHSNVAVFPNI